ncbi:MIF4G domain protein, partial [Reticulomyxa filosa]
INAEAVHDKKLSNNELLGDDKKDESSSEEKGGKSKNRNKNKNKTGSDNDNDNDNENENENDNDNESENDNENDSETMAGNNVNSKTNTDLTGNENGQHAKNSESGRTASLSPLSPKTSPDILLHAHQMKRLSEASDLQEKQQLMAEKIKLCELSCDFNATSVNEKQRINNKKELLLETLQAMNGCKWNSPQLLAACLSTIQRNLFRALPDETVPNGNQNTEEELEFKDPAWYNIINFIIIIFFFKKKLNKIKFKKKKGNICN